MEFIEFLGLDDENEDNFTPIFTYLLGTLDNQNPKEHAYVDIHLSSKFEKYLDVLRKNNCKNLVVDLNSTFSFFNRTYSEFVEQKENNPNDIVEHLSTCMFHYKKLYNLVAKSYMILINNSPSSLIYSEFSNLIMPDTSNKNAAIKLIAEAIILINSDRYLSPKHKGQIIDNLNEALANINTEKINWVTFFGTIKQSIIIIAALVTIGGPNYNLDHLINAKGKLEESIVTIEESSINQEYLDHTPDDFLIVQALEEILQIPEETEPDIDENS